MYEMLVRTQAVLVLFAGTADVWQGIKEPVDDVEEDEDEREQLARHFVDFLGVTYPVYYFHPSLTLVQVRPLWNSAWDSL